MAKRLLAAGLLSAMAVFVTPRPAHAHVDLSIAVGVPFVGAVVAPAPVYVPPPVYVPAPVVIAPPVVISGPVFYPAFRTRYYPAPAFVPVYGHRHHHCRHGWR